MGVKGTREVSGNAAWNFATIISEFAGYDPSRATAQRSSTLCTKSTKILAILNARSVLAEKTRDGNYEFRVTT